MKDKIKRKEKTFRTCTLNFLEKTFNLEEMTTLPSLENWLKTSSTIEITDFKKQELESLKALLHFNVNSWNETELSMHFIGPMFTFVEFSSKKYNLFAQREVSATVGDYLLKGKPDGIIASGRRVPEVPYFAFSEYKKNLEPEGEPAGQALAAMLVGQTLNEQQAPVYGAYVIGNDWYFMTLEGQQYAISQDFSGITDDIFDIFRILKRLKAMVIEFTRVAD